MHMNVQTPFSSFEYQGLPLQSAAVLNEISEIVPYVYDALERAIMDSTGFFPQGEKVDPFLFPNLVRYYAHKYLENAPKELDGFVIERLSNNGLFLVFGGYHIRVWKADEGHCQQLGTPNAACSFSSNPNSFPECD